MDAWGMIDEAFDKRCQMIIKRWFKDNGFETGSKGFDAFVESDEHYQIQKWLMDKYFFREYLLLLASIC